MATKRSTRTQTTRSAVAPAAGPAPVGTASTGPGGEPSGFYWDRLRAAQNDAAALDELADELERHGYAADGQIRRAVADARQALGGRGAPRQRTRRGG